MVAKIDMIISHQHKYLFLETPHTGSTAISKELLENYGGEEILHKHANYYEFLRVATETERQYFVFAGVRNPLDEAVSLYHKFLTNHKSNYTNPSKLLENGGWVSQRRIKIYQFVQETKDFGGFIKKFYGRTYTNNINLNHKYCDYIIRFESLNQNFKNALKKLGVEAKRDLPLVNKTKDRGEFEKYYSEDLLKTCAKVFGPFMLEWGYQFPFASANQITFVDHILYEMGKAGRMIYFEHVKDGALKDIKLLRNSLE